MTVSRPEFSRIVPLAQPGRIADDLGSFLGRVPFYPWRGSAYFLWDTGSPS